MRVVGEYIDTSEWSHSFLRVPRLNIQLSGKPTWPNHMMILLHRSVVIQGRILVQLQSFTFPSHLCVQLPPSAVLSETSV